jgi:hypothetical protein
MTISSAKKISICSFLNVTPLRDEFFINSPFNTKEKTPSFKINVPKNIWYDHSRGEGGNILELVIKLNNCSVSAALDILSSNPSYTPNFSFSPAKSEDKKTSDMEIISISKIKSSSLLEYLLSRSLSDNKFLEEIHYKLKDKHYYSLAFKNDSGGFELRNPYFKGCYGSKDITTIKGSQNDNLSIFEGFMDFLSALTHFKISEFKNDVIVLNSVANQKKILPLLTEYKNIYLFLDNDTAGLSAKSLFYSQNQNCIDCSNIYKNYKDFNEFINHK